MKLKFYVASFVLFILFSLHTNAQLTPPPSSAQTIIQGFGLGKITLTYSRPNVKGRKIFGYTEPYDSVWRTGANWATVIKFTDNVTLEGHNVSAGEYSLFTIPNTTEWTVILNKTVNQWGAYSYKKADDYLRFAIKPVTLPGNVETFTMAFANMFPTTGELHLMWEHTDLVIHLAVDIDAAVMARIDSAMQTAKKPYYDAVIYYYNNNKDMAKALAWANELEKVPGMSPMVAKLWKARVLLKKGDKAAAASVALEGITAAKAEGSLEYIRLNTEVLEASKK
jgi:hypothetical protein